MANEDANAENYNIRDAKTDDFEVLFTISVEVHQRDYGAFIPTTHQSAFHERYSFTDENRHKFVALVIKRYQSQRWKYWVAVDKQGRILGYTVATILDGHHAVKRGMFVRSEYQGRGIGSRLMAASLGLIEHGSIDLFVLQDNKRAQALYRRHGFGHEKLLDRTFYGAPLLQMTLEK